MNEVYIQRHQKTLVHNPSWNMLNTAVTKIDILLGPDKPAHYRLPITIPNK